MNIFRSIYNIGDRVKYRNSIYIIEGIYFTKSNIFYRVDGKLLSEQEISKVG